MRNTRWRSRPSATYLQSWRSQSTRCDHSARAVTKWPVLHCIRSVSSNVRMAQTLESPRIWKLSKILAGPGKSPLPNSQEKYRKFLGFRLVSPWISLSPRGYNVCACDLSFSICCLYCTVIRVVNYAYWWRMMCSGRCDIYRRNYRWRSEFFVIYLDSVYPFLCHSCILCQNG